MVTMSEQHDAYVASRARVAEIARPLRADQLATNVPCCPRWSAKDLVGHLTGVLEDRADKRLPTSGFEEWTDEQVARHRDESIGYVVDTWLAQPVAVNDDVPSLAALSFDVVSHEHDLCHALGIAGDRTSDSVRVGSARAQERMSATLAAAGAPGVLLTIEDGEQLVEGATAPIRLSTTRYDLMRLVTGRKSRPQAIALAWDGDATPVLEALFADGFFTLQPVDVIEADATPSR
jgi:uncharacterized protein (TIGR03083 family)